MPKLTIRRDRGWADKLRKYSILLDGLEVGLLAEGEEIVVPIAEGPHTLEARIDWCGSPLFRFEAKAAHPVVQVGNALRGWRAWLALFVVLFDRQGYLTAELVQGERG